MELVAFLCVVVNCESGFPKKSRTADVPGQPQQVRFSRKTPGAEPRALRCFIMYSACDTKITHDNGVDVMELVKGTLLACLPPEMMRMVTMLVVRLIMSLLDIPTR